MVLQSVLRRLVRSRRVSPAARRFMGGGGHGESFHGVHIHPPARWQSLYGEGAFILMWFWMMYRAKQDGAGGTTWAQGHGTAVRTGVGLSVLTFAAG